MPTAGDTAQSYPCRVATTQVARAATPTRRAPTARASRPGARASTRPSSEPVERLGCRAAARLHEPSTRRELARHAQPVPSPCRRHCDRNGARLVERQAPTRTEPVARATRAPGDRPRRTTHRSRPCGGSGFTSTWYQTDLTKVPTNRPCNVGWTSATGGYAAGGVWNAGTYFSGVAATSGNRLCRWPSFNYVSTAGTPATNPIAANRSPGFWGVIRGPGDVTDLGDAFSVRCRVNQNCGSDIEPGLPDTGYWYVIKMPASGATTTTIRLFDAAYNDSINASSGAGPAADQGGTFTQRQRLHHDLPALQAEQPARLHRSHRRAARARRCPSRRRPATP